MVLMGVLPDAYPDPPVCATIAPRLALEATARGRGVGMRVCRDTTEPCVGGTGRGWGNSRNKNGATGQSGSVHGVHRSNRREQAGTVSSDTQYASQDTERKHGAQDTTEVVHSTG